MSWQESAPGHYQRPLNGSEQGMIGWITTKEPGAREPIKIQAVADFTAPHTAEKVAEAFREAWKALRLLKEPDIATTFGDGQKLYKVPSAADLETWLDETFKVAVRGQSVQTVVRDMHGAQGWLPVCYLVPATASEGSFKGSLVLFISHWRTEASGAFMILNQLFDYATDLLDGTSIREALSKHTLGNEARLLTPTLEDILMPNQLSSLDAKSRVKKHFEDYYAKLPSIDYLMEGISSAAPSYVKLHQRTYTPASTSSMVKACKANGISVTAAVHSAYLGAVWQIASPDMQKRSYASLMPAQVRTRLPTSSPYRTQGCWSAAQMLMLTAPAGQDFLTRAKSLGEQYKLANQQTWLHEDTREIGEQMANEPAGLPDQPESMPWFTGLGVLDGEVIVPEHGTSFKIESVTAWADPVSPGIVLRFWTFRGRLNIQMVWNFAFHGDEQIKVTMDLVDGILAEALSVGVEIESVSISEF